MKKRLDKEATNSVVKGERLGREENSKTNARKSFRRLNEGNAWAPVSKFEPPKNSNEISVNRMDLANENTFAVLGKRNAASLGKLFWGWYILTKEAVEDVGCSVKQSPLDENPYHADIIIPVSLDAEERRDNVIDYARDLAYQANFLPWGEWTNG